VAGQADLELALSCLVLMVDRVRRDVAKKNIWGKVTEML
jgi:hypothetical protein